MLAGCASGGLPDVIEAREVFTASGAPRIARVRDAGNARVPGLGAWKGEADGIAVPGEVVVIEGDNFGRQPTLSIGGRATGILARTDGGGIVARVPNGVPVGDIEVSVAHPKGKAVGTLKLVRLALVVHGGHAYVLEVSRDGVRPRGAPLSVPGAHELRMSADGSAAYLLASRPGGDRLLVIDLAAPGGPRVAVERPLSHRATQLASAQDASVVAAVGEDKLTLFDGRLPASPMPFEAVAMPKELGQPRTIELSPDGKVLAVLIAEGNKLALLEVDRPGVAKLVTSVELLPGTRLPLVRDLAFSSDGETLWVVSGDNAQSLPAIEPTRLTAVRVIFDDAPVAGRPRSRLLSVWRTQSVPGAAAPIRLAIARGQPLASGTTIRMPPDKAAVFVTSVNDALFKLADLALDTSAGAKAALKLWKPPQPGMMVRADINGGGGPLFATVQLMSAVDLTPDAQLVLATSARVSPVPATDGVVLDFGVTVSPIWGSPAPTFLPLGPLLAAELKPPFQIGDVRIQP